MTSETNQDEERLVGELRAAWARGDSPSALVRSLTSQGIIGAPVIILMMRAFALTLSITNAIAAWFTHADDQRLDRHLMPHMPARTPAGPTGEPEQ
jgi:hypothetical protein